MINELNKELLVKINEVRKSGNFQTLRRKIGANKIKEFITSMYPKYSIPEIEAITGIPDSTLERWFEQLKIPRVRRHFTNVSIPGNFDAEIVLSDVKAAKKFSVINVTPELAYLIGFSLGDGAVQKFMVETFNRDRKLREHLLVIMKPYGSVTETEREDGLWKLRLSSVKIANLIKDEKGIRQDTLDYIFDEEELAKKFVAAFWDAEGTVRKQGNYYHLYLYNSNESLLEKIKEFLTSKNISFSTFVKKYDFNRVYFLKGRRIIARKPIHRISIPESSCDLWINEIGSHMLHSKKSAVVNEMSKKFVKEED